MTAALWWPSAAAALALLAVLVAAYTVGPRPRHLLRRSSPTVRLLLRGRTAVLRRTPAHRGLR